MALEVVAALFPNGEIEKRRTTARPSKLQRSTVPVLVWQEEYPKMRRTRMNRLKILARALQIKFSCMTVVIQYSNIVFEYSCSQIR